MNTTTNGMVSNFILGFYLINAKAENQGGIVLSHN